MPKTIEDLKKIKIFNNINIDTIMKSKEFFNIRDIEKGEILFEEKEELINIYFVIEGKVNIYKTTESGQKKIIYLLWDGEMINEDIFERRISSIGCEAFERSKIACIAIDKVLELMAEDKGLMVNVVTSMSKKVRRLYRQLKNTVSKKIDRKVAAKLWRLSKEYGKDTAEGTLIDLNPTITYLADMLGHPRENISKAMEQLELQEIISYRGKKIIVSKEKLLSFHKNM